MRRYIYTGMSIIQEVFSRVTRLQSYDLNDSRSILNNVNNIWTDFIFKDVRKAEELTTQGYDFTLIGQDIYEQAVDTELPTGHYSYLLLIMYNRRLINPLDHKVGLNTALYDDLSNSYINVSGCSVVCSSVYRKTVSANIFISTYNDIDSKYSLKMNSVLGDSLTYIGVSIPYLRFGSKVPVRFCTNQVDNTTIVNVKCIVDISFDTHMGGIMSETIQCSFII